MSFDIIALKTDEARRREAEMALTGKSFKVVGFSIGNAGHDPLDPTTALAPDPAALTCADVVFGPKGLAGGTMANDFCPIFECFLDRPEAVSLFSSVCLLAEILSSPFPSDPEIGSTFLYAVANFPQRPKTDGTTLSIRVGIQG